MINSRSLLTSDSAFIIPHSSFPLPRYTPRPRDLMSRDNETLPPLMQSTVTDDGSGGVSPIPDASTHPLHRHPPTQIGPYHILDVLGEGGMGTVYKAEQRHPIKRIVALKVIRMGIDS